ncbi:MAG: hypothetical protein A2X13_06055 [Bacteroidetes bacterium GWC2_33_15]|nr:MAG: hypothetical protein A2X10_03705 [Bacteroidetes bacterium GWA2_33_15]OFX51787.1 MAG: hypothetical protein A2X13_06055 [Bacteroidetes bacterium GWC2_33_15]OFX66841.1 MAG: hypothetical protein A2X15_09070 [Bacteroidetes bacterium GWB2_32_14]OFX67099.1 MAG: hypothetical protein A2X14_10575 [Bacteroidetes bacterium GWD2_33_33]HAN17190.1 hypothetical protein [Bacteroidales bacterium]
MKTIYFLNVLLYFFMNPIFANNDTMLICGKAYDSEMKVNVYFDNKSYSSEVDNQEFSMKVPTNKGYGYIRYKETYKVYFSGKSGYNFQFNETNGKEELVIKSEQDEINKYLMDKNKRLKENELEIRYFNLPIYKLNYIEFTHFVDSVFSFQNSILTNEKFQDDYFNYIENLELASMKASFILKYLLINEVNNLPDNEVFKKITLNDTIGYYGSDEYIQFVNLYIDKVSQDSIKNNGLLLSDYVFVKYKMINQLISDNTIKYDMLSGLLKKAICDFGITKEVTLIYNDYLNNRAPVYKNDDIENLYIRMNALSKGEMPSLVAYDVDTNEVFLENLTGENIFLLIYSFRCKECLDEIQFIKKNESLFTDKNVTLVTIAIDGTYDEWISFLKRENLEKGIHLHAFQNRREILEKLLVMKLPVGIVIDSNFKIKQIRVQKLTDINLNEILTF